MIYTHTQTHIVHPYGPTCCSSLWLLHSHSLRAALRVYRPTEHRFAQQSIAMSFARVLFAFGLSLVVAEESPSLRGRNDPGAGAE